MIAEETPGFDDPFRLGRRRWSADRTLATTGLAFRRAAEPVKARFVEHGLPPDFLEQLQGLVEQFEQAIRGREAGKDEYAAARAGIVGAMEAASAAARKLDVIVANQFAGNPLTAAGWTRARHVNSRPRSKRAAGAAGAVPAAPEAPHDAAPLGSGSSGDGRCRDDTGGSGDLDRAVETGRALKAARTPGRPGGRPASLTSRPCSSLGVAYSFFPDGYTF